MLFLCFRKLELDPGGFTVCIKVWSRIDNKTCFGGFEISATSVNVRRAVFESDSYAKGRGKVQ